LFFSITLRLRPEGRPVSIFKNQKLHQRSEAELRLFSEKLLRLLRSVALCCDLKNAFSPRLTREVARLRSQL
jgi:hypothetical protein